MKKFELTTDTKTFSGRKLFRIKALISFGDVKKGELGGYIEKEENLDHNGDAWICGDACVCGDADFTYIHGFGSENRTTTFYKTKDGGIGVKCGRFCGTLQEFRNEVRKTHGDSVHAKEYLMIADLMEMHLSNK